MLHPVCAAGPSSPWPRRGRGCDGPGALAGGWNCSHTYINKSHPPTPNSQTFEFVGSWALGSWALTRFRRLVRLIVVIQIELVWMRPQANRVELFLSLVRNPRFDQVFREHRAARQERVILFERDERFLERSGCRLDAHLTHLVPGHLVDVAVERLARIDLVLNAVEHGHQHRGPRKVSVAAWIGAAELEPLGFRALGVHRDANRGGAVARRQREVHRRLESGHEPAIGVRRGRGEGEDRWRVFQQPARGPQPCLAEAGVAVPGEEWLASLPQRGM